MIIFLTPKSPKGDFNRGGNYLLYLVTPRKSPLGDLGGEKTI